MLSSLQNRNTYCAACQRSFSFLYQTEVALDVSNLKTSCPYCDTKLIIPLPLGRKVFAYNAGRSEEKWSVNLSDPMYSQLDKS